MPEILDPTPAALERAADTLRRGGLVAFPTETVYGLGADAVNPLAVRAIYRVKRRPVGHPLIVHLAGPDRLGGWVAEVSVRARSLIDAFWPGPLTLILPSGPAAHHGLTGGQPTVGVRVPSHPVARALLDAFGGAVAAPSANRFGRISPTRAEHVASEFADCAEPLVLLDGGASEMGLESTILDLTGARPVLLRPGSVSAADIAVVVGLRPLPPGADSPRAPGRLHSHYAPATPTVLLERSALEATLERGASRLGVLTFMETSQLSAGAWKQLPGDPVAAGRLLYSHLRDLDVAGLDAILIEAPPSGTSWDAVRDRVQKAAASRAARSDQESDRTTADEKRYGRRDEEER